MSASQLITWASNQAKSIAPRKVVAPLVTDNLIETLPVESECEQVSVYESMINESEMDAEHTHREDVIVNNL